MQTRSRRRGKSADAGGLPTHRASLSADRATGRRTVRPPPTRRRSSRRATSASSGTELGVGPVAPAGTPGGTTGAAQPGPGSGTSRVRAAAAAGPTTGHSPHSRPDLVALTRYLHAPMLATSGPPGVGSYRHCATSPTCPAPGKGTAGPSPAFRGDTPGNVFCHRVGRNPKCRLGDSPTATVCPPIWHIRCNATGRTEAHSSPCPKVAAPRKRGGSRPRTPFLLADGR